MIMEPTVELVRLDTVEQVEAYGDEYPIICSLGGTRYDVYGVQNFYWRDGPELTFLGSDQNGGIARNLPVWAIVVK
jgi:hypothetical protein